MQPWEHQQNRQQQHRAYRPNNRPPSARSWPVHAPPAPPFMPFVRPQPRPVLSADENNFIEKMAETQARNPAVVELVKKSHWNDPKYHFLFEASPLHLYYQWRVTQQQQQSSTDRRGKPPSPPLYHTARPPYPMPLPPLLPLPAVTAPTPQHGQETCDTKSPDNAKAKECSTRRYFELPAGLMVTAITEDHPPYSALQASKLEDAEFLESIMPGLSTFTDEIPAPELTDQLSQALADFDKGVRYIYNEGEFEHRKDELPGTNNQDNEIADVNMDKDGWQPGVLEKVLWDRRKGSEQRKRWKHRQERAKLRLEGQNVSDTTESSLESTSESDTSSNSTSSSGSDSSDSDAIARPTNINKAIGRDNIGFQLLSKLGWQQGQGLGASSEGIVEPIRPATRFSTVRGRFSHRGRGRGRGKRVERASLGTGIHKEPAQQHVPKDTSGKDADDKFESYRQQMSSAYRHENPEN